MDENSILLPVKCPKCGTKSLYAYPKLVVMVALTRWNHLLLYAPCHEGSWDASDTEVRALRAFVGENWLRDHEDLIIQ